MTDAVTTRTLVVGATGNVGGKLIASLLRESLTRPRLQVAALVREGSDATKLLALRGVEIVRGDMLDEDSLSRAITGVDVVFMTAASYMGRRKGDSAVKDEVGLRALVQAAKRAKVKCFVLASVINADRAPQVPQLLAKAHAEQMLRDTGVPFVSVRTGLFLDQGNEMYEKDVRRNVLTSIGDPNAARFTMTTASMYADTMVRAAFTTGACNLIIDVGFREPLTMNELANLVSVSTHRPIQVRVMPLWTFRLMCSVGALFSESFTNVKAMMNFIVADDGAHFRGDFSTYERVFGVQVPTAQEGIERWVRERGLVLR